MQTATALSSVFTKVLDFIKPLEYDARTKDKNGNFKAFWDYQQWSIGYGTKSKQGEIITPNEALERLSKEVNKQFALVKDLSLTDNQKIALTSFSYNLGSDGLRKILKYIKTNGKEYAAQKMLLYTGAGGKKLNGLVDRRKKEVQLFLS